MPDIPMTGLAAVPWRTGRTLGRTLYARTGGDDWKADTAIGMLDTPELAAEACAAHNAVLSLEQLAAAGYDVCTGTCKGPGQSGMYASLEHLGLDEPEEFYGQTVAEALAKAREWAEGKP